MRHDLRMERAERPPIPAWLPNALTALRLALIPAFVVHACWCAEAVAAGATGTTHRFLAASALIGIGVSDVLDGWLARRFGLATPFGAVADAVADKLAQVSLLVFFVFAGGEAFARVPLWFLVLVLARDVVLAAGTSAVRLRRGEVQVVHEPHGKLASFLLFVLLVWVTVDLPRGPVLPALAGISAIVLMSTLVYVREGWRQWTTEPAG